MKQNQPWRHTWRRSLATRESATELDETGIRISPPDGVMRFIQYADIARLSLRSRHYRFHPPMYICRIEPRGAPAIDVCSTGGQKLLWLQDHGDTYRSFVEELHRRLVFRQPPPDFHAGDPPWLFACRLVSWFVFVPAFFYGFFAVLGGTFWLPLPFAIVALFPWVFVSFIYWPLHLRPNRPRPYDPRAMPPELLQREKLPP